MSRRSTRTVVTLLVVVLTVLAWLYVAALMVVVWRAVLSLDGVL